MRRQVGLQLRRGPREFVHCDGAESTERRDARFDAKSLGTYVRFVQHDIIDRVALEEVVQWLSENGEELLELGEVPPVPSPNHRIPPPAPHETPLHRPHSPYA